MAKEPSLKDDKIKCELDGAMVHSISLHLQRHHPGYTMEEYSKNFPTAPLYSDSAKTLILYRQKQKKVEAENVSRFEMRPMADVFNLGKAAAALNPRGQPILAPYYIGHTDEDAALIPVVDENYIFDIDRIKSVLIASHIRAPLYVWGYHGSGKTTVLEQISARQNAPMVRIQHTINTEEAHIVGQYVVRDGETVFQYGPLALAMIHGHRYLADEYDRAPPTVLSVYQPVLEGKALYIKEAPPDMRRIEPHPNFCFWATGNTNGAGDETGLYQGAVMQDAANFSRFGVTEMVDYMEPKIESSVVQAQAAIAPQDAKKLVDYAGHVRESFKAGRLSATISPRELIFAGKFGAARGGAWREGIAKAWANRLNRVDREVVEHFAQRIFT